MAKRVAPGGERYQSLVKQLSSRKGIAKPHALAVEAGKKKYGAPRGKGETVLPLHKKRRIHGEG